MLYFEGRVMRFIGNSMFNQDLLLLYRYTRVNIMYIISKFVLHWNL